MRKLAFTLTIVVLLALVAVPACAQGNTPHVLRSTRPISEQLRGSLDAWLATDAPYDTQYYIVTYVEDSGTNTYVSLVAVALATPDEEFSFEDGSKVLWMGTVIVADDGTVTLKATPQTSTMQIVHRAMIRAAAGGGSYVAFPFASGTTALYGSRGVHPAGYGTSGMNAVDLVGGDAMGASVMGPKVYASDTGTVDYVCDDGTSVAIRTYNSTTGDYFIYAHMLDNASLAMDQEFTRGQYIGALKYGSFNPSGTNCGWASQGDNQYHVHWAFVPSGGIYQVGACTLTISTQKWNCGGKVTAVGGYLTGGGGYNSAGTAGGNASGRSGAGETVTDPTFFDYVLTGILNIADRGILKLLPSHNAFEYTYLLFNTVQVVMKIVWVLVASNINLGPLAAVLLLGIGIRLIFGVAWLGAFILKAWKSLVPILGA